MIKSKISKIIGIILLILFIYTFFSIKEDFAPLQNYCLSANRTFIAISDNHDPRCLHNQQKQTQSIQPILNYIPCLTKGQGWGMQYLNKCFPLSTSQTDQPSPLFSNSQLFQEMSGMEFSGNDLSNSEFSGNQTQNTLNKLNFQINCQQTRLPNSGPCFPIFEHFDTNDKSLHKPSIDCSNTQNLTLDQQCQCYTNDNRYGFYKIIKTGNQGSMVCRKYYKSQNNDSNKLGIYSPNDYHVYVPKKPNSEELNMTGCLPRDTDFNEMCIMQNKNDRYGTYQILYGEDGNCYDPISDLQNQNYGNAICSQNHYQNVPKLWSGKIPLTNQSFSPNYFTQCIPMKPNLQKIFQNECDKIELSGMPLTAYEIDSYDCPPGEGRAKCKYQSEFS